MHLLSLFLPKGLQHSWSPLHGSLYPTPPSRLERLSGGHSRLAVPMSRLPRDGQRAGAVVQYILNESFSSFPSLPISLHMPHLPSSLLISRLFLPVFTDAVHSFVFYTAFLRPVDLVE